MITHEYPVTLVCIYYNIKFSDGLIKSWQFFFDNQHVFLVQAAQIFAQPITSIKTITLTYVYILVHKQCCTLFHPDWLFPPCILNGKKTYCYVLILHTGTE